jgi:signal transduction histidine kinase
VADGGRAVLAWLREHRRGDALLVAVVAVALTVSAVVDGVPPETQLVGMLAIAALSYALGAHEPTRRGVAAVVVLMAAIQVSVGFSEFPNAEISFMTLAPWWAGRAVARRRALVAELDARTRELEVEEDAFVGLAVQRERARIARELHDVVSHHVAVMVIQAGAGRMSPTGDGTARMATIRAAGEQALADMDRLVALLDGDHHDLARLLADARTAGPHVLVEALPPGTRLPAPVAAAAHGIVREALTNALKHAPGQPLAVRLAVADEALVIDAHNASTAGGSALAATGSGLGLLGMRERAVALGGSLEAGPAADGWTVCARLPLHAAGQDDPR